MYNLYISIAVISSIYLFLLNYFLKKFNFLIDKNIKTYSHKRFVNKQNNLVPISGGIFIITFIFILKSEYSYFLFLIFILGLLSDLDILSSPKVRIFIQIFIIGLLLILKNIYIPEIRLKYFDHLISNYQVISILFSVFCLITLVNGSNFVDGVNNLLSGYFLTVLLFILFVAYKEKLTFDFQFFKLFFLILLIFFIYNFFNQSFLGDGGSYLLGTFMGIYLIIFFIENRNISPYFIMNLLWYPAFENLFSIIRRLLNNNKTSKPDTMHLHHQIFLFFFNRSKRKNFFISSFVGILINIFNFIFFYFLIKNIYSTQYQLFGTCFVISSYLLIYNLLFKLDRKYKKINLK